MLENQAKNLIYDIASEASVIIFFEGFQIKTIKIYILCLLTDFSFLEKSRTFSVKNRN